MMETSTSMRFLPNFLFWIMTTFLVVIFIVLSISGWVLYSLLTPVKEPIKERPKVPYQEIHFTSKAGNVPLQGWLIPTNSSQKKIVIFAHGYGDNRSNLEAVLPMAHALYKKGISSLLFDFRNSGKSGGNMTTVGIDEQKDLLAAIEFAQAKGYKKIGLMGFSMGASTSIIASAQSDQVQAVVADSPFSDLKPYLSMNLPVWSGLPSFFNPIILTMAEWIGLDMTQVRPIEAVKQMRNTPLFLIHTKKETSIPSIHSVRLASLHDQKITQLWLTPGNKHVESYSKKPQEYIKRVTAFFEKYLS